jgi:hypothetical protein
MLKTRLSLFKTPLLTRAFSATTAPPEAIEKLKKLGITNKNIVYNPS